MRPRPAASLAEPRASPLPESTETCSALPRRATLLLPGVEEVVPVDLHIPGCPPSPTALLAGLVALLEKANARVGTP